MMAFSFTPIFQPRKELNHNLPSVGIDRLQMPPIRQVDVQSVGCWGSMTHGSSQGPLLHSSRDSLQILTEKVKI